MERRAIFEEAAGVTKFKTKKRLAEAKLESSKLNLARVNDIVIEVEKQLGSLKREAAKARRYSEIRDQMRGIVRQMLAGKARELDAAAERIGKQLEELSAVETERAAAIQQMEGEQDRLNQRIYELDAELRQNQNVLNLTALEADRSENRIAFNRQRAQELAGRHAQMDAELKQARAQAAEWEMRSATQGQAGGPPGGEAGGGEGRVEELLQRDRKSTRLNSSHRYISYAVFCLEKKNKVSTAARISQRARRRDRRTPDAVHPVRDPRTAGRTTTRATTARSTSHAARMDRTL